MEELIPLVEQARSGDLEAYGDLVRRFQDMAVGYAYSRLGDFHLAEDAAQEAFLEAHACLPGLREPLAFPGWLRRIVFKHCDRFTRKKGFALAPLDEEIRADTRDPAELLDEGETRDLVSAAIRTLPEHQRMVISLFYISQHSHQEIAAFLGVPLTTVNNRLHAARERLKKELSTMARKKLQSQRPSRDETFVSGIMDGLLARSDQEVQLLIQNVDQKDLLIGLMGSSQEVRDKVFSNMAERVRNFLEGEMEVFQKQFAEMAPEDVEEIQKLIVAELDKPRPKLSKRYLTWKAKLEKTIEEKPSAQMDFSELKDLLVGMADVARHEGVLTLGSLSGETLEGLLRPPHSPSHRRRPDRSRMGGWRPRGGHRQRGGRTCRG